MWPEKEVSDVREVFVQSLADLLWYIDNHHSTFNERSHKIPPIFDRFTGYNMPQVHKHQKRSAENLSSVLLTDKLFRCLQSCYWERSIWRNFKTEVEMLAKSVYDYASYLRDQNNVKVIDSEVCVDKVTNKSVKNYENLQKFFDHCCQARYYSFCIKKCGVDGCNICKPIAYLVKSLTRLASYLILYHKMMGIIRTSKKCLGLSLLKTTDHHCRNDSTVRRVCHFL